MGKNSVALVWENHGPSHNDRIAACVAAGWQVTAIQFYAKSHVYQWEGADVPGAQRVTLAAPDQRMGTLGLAWRLIRAVRASRARAVFLCHYQLPAVFLAAAMLRLLGRRVYTMIDSKFDDYRRHWWREPGKALLLAPYNGALAGSRRSAEYLRFLGFGRRPVAGGFDTLDLARIRALGGTKPALPHANRDFLIVARLVEKKNLGLAIAAFAAWREQACHPRKLRILGYGELEAELRGLADRLGLGESVVFEGYADSARVSRAMRDGLCLILPSTEEQFGLVVIEALALGLPVLVSANAGAVDELIDNGVNGWIINPERPAALQAAMALLDGDPALWRKASAAALDSSERGDVRHFVAGARSLIGTAQVG